MPGAVPGAEMWPWAPRPPSLPSLLSFQLGEQPVIVAPLENPNTGPVARLGRSSKSPWESDTRGVGGSPGEAQLELRLGP